LTTRQQADAWRADAADGSWLTGSLEGAVAEAAARGHDVTGRFRTVTDWLEEQPAGTAAPGRRAPPLLVDRLAAGESEWEPLAGAEKDDSLVVVRRDALPVLAVTLTVLLAFVGWRVGPWHRLWRYGLLLVWLGLGGLALLWVPTTLWPLVWWPMLGGIILALTWHLWSAVASRWSPRSPGGRGTAAAALALVFTAGLPGRADAPSPYTVWIVPDPGGASEKQTVLVAPELLEQLQALTRRGPQALQGAVLLSSRFEGQAVPGRVEFLAHFQAHCFTDEPAVLALPLGGVDLQEVLLDGAVAHAVTQAPPRTGYALPVKGRGAHVCRVRFSVRLPAQGEDREVRFTVPELTQSRLTLAVPDGARFLQAVGVRGAQRVTTETGAPRLEADIGRVGTVLVRWREERPLPAPATVQVKEAYLWDLQASASRLLGVLEYTVRKGAVTALALDLPDELEIRKVEVARLPGAGTEPRLQQWNRSHTGARRGVRLEFQGPVTEGVQVFVELVPVRPFGPEVALPALTPRDVQFAEGLLAYRVEGLEATVIDDRRLPPRDAESLHRVWQTAKLEDPGPLERAFGFRRTAGETPSVRLRLHTPRPRARCLQNLVWRVYPTQVELRATARLTTTGEEDLALVEWKVPAEVVLTEVGGPQVRSWSRAGPRVQVWLQRSLGETAVELRGWLARPAGEPAALFVLPRLRLSAAEPHTTWVRVTAEDGLTLRPVELTRLVPPPESGSAEQEWVYVARERDYGAVFQVRPASSRVGVRLLTLAEVRDRKLTFVTTLELHTPPQDPAVVKVHLRNWDGADVRLEAPPTVRRREQRRDPTGRTWLLDLAPGAAGPCQVRLSGSMALEALSEAPFPNVSVEGATSVERWVALAGPELRAEDAQGLSRTPDPVAALQPWPAVEEQVKRHRGAVWKVEADDWRLRLRAESPRAEDRLVQVFLAEYAAAVLDGCRWTHQATYWLYHEAGADLNLLLPDGARALGVEVDGQEVPLLESAPQRLWLPLAGRGGPRTLRLRWTFAAGEEELDRPNLAKPRLEGVAEGPAVWTVHVPAGYTVDRLGGEPAGASVVGQDLWRAAALLDLSRTLATQTGGSPAGTTAQQLAALQERFYHYRRLAEYRLALGGSPPGSGPSGQGLGDWLQELDVQNRELAQGQHFERVRAQAEKQALAFPSPRQAPAPGESFGTPPGDALMESGTPTYWQTPPDAATPSFRLTPVAARETRQRWLGTGVILLLLAAAWGLSYFPQAAAWAQRLWPEQLALLGLLGWQLFGFELAAAGLILLGVGSRLLLTGRWLVARLRRLAA
jgi:hypothetical protein